MQTPDDQAVAAWLKTKTLSGAPPETIAALRQAYTSAGITGYWKKELEMAQERLKKGNIRPWRMARIYAELGEKDEAFKWINQAYEERESLMVFLKVIPIFDSLHADPRFADLLRRMGLAQ